MSQARRAISKAAGHRIGAPASIKTCVHGTADLALIRRLAASRERLSRLIPRTLRRFVALSTTDGFAPPPDFRPLAKFGTRGLKLGHRMWDVIFRRGWRLSRYRVRCSVPNERRYELSRTPGGHDDVGSGATAPRRDQLWHRHLVSNARVALVGIILFFLGSPLVYIVLAAYFGPMLSLGIVAAMHVYCVATRWSSAGIPCIVAAVFFLVAQFMTPVPLVTQ